MRLWVKKKTTKKTQLSKHRAQLGKHTACGGWRLCREDAKCTTVHYHSVAQIKHGSHLMSVTNNPSFAL